MKKSTFKKFTCFVAACTLVVSGVLGASFKETNVASAASSTVTTEYGLTNITTAPSTRRYYDAPYTSRAAGDVEYITFAQRDDSIVVLAVVQPLEQRADAAAQAQTRDEYQVGDVRAVQGAAHHHADTAQHGADVHAHHHGRKLLHLPSPQMRVMSLRRWMPSFSISTGSCSMMVLQQ